MPDPAPQAARPPRPIEVSPPAAGILWRHRLSIGLAAAIIAGFVFRLIWLRDIEYKGDEAWVAMQVKTFWRSHSWPGIGIPSSTGLAHPGLNLWVFLAISALLPTAGPLELTRSVEVINIIAIISLVFFAQKAVVRAEREPWLWTVALLSVNPLAVLYARKLWAQDLLPLFVIGMLWGFWYRRQRWGAFLWGLLGALLGQVHLAGFFLAAAFLGVILLFDRRSPRWLAWFGGGLVGLVPLLPWLVVIGKGIGPVHAAHFNNPIIPFGHWVNFALGIDLYKSLGDDFLSFLSFPKIYLHSSYLAGTLLGVIVIIFAILLTRLLSQFRADRARTTTALLGTRSSTGLAFIAGFFGYCSLLAAMSQPTFLHYMIIAQPLPALWLAWIGRAGCGEGGGSMANARGLLAALVMAQAGLTVLFLVYIHQTQVIHGDFGVAFGSQLHPGFTP